MLTVVRAVGVLGLSLGVLIGGCDDGDAGDDGGPGDGSSTGTPQTTDPSAATAASQGTGSEDTGGATQSTTEPGSGETSSAHSGTPETSSDGGSTGDGDSGSGSTTTGEQAFDPEFVWVADFMLGNCVGCHVNDANGMLILPEVDLSYDEVRLAIEGITANTGLLLVEPGDRNASQTYLQITNEFGAQFPVEDTDRFGAWIDAGAPYDAQ